MALIRCPSCDTLHDIEGSFFANGARKVRCASCREVWEAVAPESPAIESTVAEPDPWEEALAETEAAPPPAGEPLPDQAPLDQAAIDAMDFGAPEPSAAAKSVSDAPAPPADETMAAGESADISAEELEALFADPEPVAAPQPVAEAAPAKKDAEEIVFDPASLARAQDEAAKSRSDQSEDARLNRRERRPAAGQSRAAAGKAGSRPVAAMFMAAGLGTLAVVGLFRVEIARLFPATAPVFEAVGLGGQHALDISQVRGRLVQDGEHDMLEVTGTIANLAKAPQKIPVLRLSIRSPNGQEIYVWTALADKTDLAPGEKTTFARRLASPPQGSHSVLVRFVAKDDIVAAIR